MLTGDGQAVPPLLLLLLRPPPCPPPFKYVFKSTYNTIPNLTMFQNIVVQRATFLAPAAPNSVPAGKARALRRKEKKKVKAKKVEKKKLENGSASVKELVSRLLISTLPYHKAGANTDDIYVVGRG